MPALFDLSWFVMTDTISNSPSQPEVVAGQRPLERNLLEKWVQAPHLEPAAVGQYRSLFTSHTARALVIKNLLVPAVADRLSRFLAKEAEFAPEYGLYSREGAVNEEAWMAGQEHDRFFRLHRLVRTPTQFQMSPNALTYLQFRKAFQHLEFKAFFEAITGLPLGWSDDFGAHSMGNGDFLRPHSDANRDRRVALVIYLTPGWRPEWGGTLHIVDTGRRVMEVTPEFNSMVVFDVLGAPEHYVAPIELPAGAPPRLTIGGWYHNAR